MMTINERVKELRKNHLNLTMEQFGKRVGVGKTAISSIENGTNKVSEQMFSAIVNMFHVRPEWLRDGEGEMFDKQSGLLGKLRHEYNLTDLETAIIAEFIQMNPRERELMLEYGRNLLKKAEMRLVEEEDPAYEPGSKEGIAAAEAAYEKRFGIAPLPESTASSITDEEQRA